MTDVWLREDTMKSACLGPRKKRGVRKEAVLSHPACWQVKIYDATSEYEVSAELNDAQVTVKASRIGDLACCCICQSAAVACSA
jgi:hypothetical protein